jgi:hypothetical protein
MPRSPASPASPAAAAAAAAGNELYLDAMGEMMEGFQRVASAPPTSLAARGRTGSFGGLPSSRNNTHGSTASGGLHAYHKMAVPPCTESDV